VSWHSPVLTLDWRKSSDSAAAGARLVPIMLQVFRLASEECGLKNDVALEKNNLALFEKGAAARKNVQMRNIIGGGCIR
jgi:hypothetical protein